MFACVAFESKTSLLREKFLVQVGVCQGAERKPKSVLQEKIEKGRYGGRYGMFRFNVLGL